MNDDLEKPLHSEKNLDYILNSPKAQEIVNACESLNIERLCTLAISNEGLLHDQLRSQAWPIILGSALNEDDQEKNVSYDKWHDLPAHNDEEQIAKDVARSFVYYPDPQSSIDSQGTHHLKNSLGDLILSVLRNHSRLSYFQGYHDIASVLLLALGPKLAPLALARLSLLRIRDFMLPSLSPTVSYLYLLPALLRQSDPDLAILLPNPSTYALAATLTLFAHVVTAYASIARLFDFILASHAAAPVYLFAASLRARRHQILNLDPADPDMLLFALSQIPEPKSYDVLVADAQSLLVVHPPSSLSINRVTLIPGSCVSTISVLYTAPSAVAVASQSLEKAEVWWDRQADEARKRDILVKKLQHTQRWLRRNRRPIVYSGGAILIALVAALAARNGSASERSFVLLRSAFLGIWGSVGRR